MSGGNEILALVIILPAILKVLFIEAEVAGIARYRRVKIAKIRNLWLLFFQNRKALDLEDLLAFLKYMLYSFLVEIGLIYKSWSESLFIGYIIYIGCFVG